MRVFAGIVALAMIASPALAQDWGTDFNMGTFAAGGGSPDNGYLNLECAGEGSGFDFAGQPFIALTVIDGEQLDKKSLPDEITFWVDDEQSYLLPMSIEEGSTTRLVYDYSADTVEQARGLVEAMRQGSIVTAKADENVIASLDLEGSNDTLELVEDCIAP